MTGSLAERGQGTVRVGDRTVDCEWRFVRGVDSLRTVLACLVIALVLGYLTPDRAVALSQDSVRITYVGNEGFLIEADGRKVLIDALYRTGVAGYVVHTPTLRRSLEKALPPFDGSDVVLETHYHADHFDPNAVGSHLVNNRSARLVSTAQVVAQLEDTFPAWRHIAPRVDVAQPQEGDMTVFDFDGVIVTVLNLHHGRDRPVENLGFVIEMGDWKFLHIGDAEVAPEEFTALGLSEMDLDVFFVPYWFLAYSEWDNRIEPAVGSPKLVAMHVPPVDDPKGYLSELGGFDGLVRKIHSKYTTAIVFAEPMESIVIR